MWGNCGVPRTEYGVRGTQRAGPIRCARQFAVSLGFMRLGQRARGFTVHLGPRQSRERRMGGSGIAIT